MNIPNTLEAITILILILIPGYIFLQFTKRSVAFSDKTVNARYLLALVVWSGVIHGLGAQWTLPLIDSYRKGQLAEDPWQVVRLAFIWIIIAPIVMAFLGTKLAKAKIVDEKLLKPFGLDYASRIPSAWNYAILTGTAYIRVYLTDGSAIGGAFGSKSFADHDAEQDIFLEAVYNLDENGDFVDVVSDTGGVWIPRESIKFMLFFKHPTDTNQQMPLQHNKDGDPYG